MTYTVHQAKTQFSKLLREAEAGKEVIVMRGSKPVAKIIPISSVPDTAKRRMAGGFEGLVSFDDSVFDPLTDEQMIEYGFDNPAKDERYKDFVDTGRARSESAE
ncbi:type II toxin-antitoxin system Phd/YefM family antitoxin [Acidicapsa dinghuensis]|uniref:Antitoxin n=1 Tax=Acidicapsa dinghuensis TaxID=2218256 RepID=A0ABW1EC88_9BACT|nr:type II toxin-antitoxin system prevent-host-death family antitoxin [Acidicapsa dinghuensis]